MGIMLLPSLEEKRHIRLESISQTEAELFIKNLEERVKASRNLNTPAKSIPDAFQIYRLLSDLQDYDIEDILEDLSESDVPRQRGIRAVFIDEETDTIIVGTTLVYSDKWAMVGVDDDTLPDQILEMEY
jgi:hypothetical protein